MIGSRLSARNDLVSVIEEADAADSDDAYVGSNGVPTISFVGKWREMMVL